MDDAENVFLHNFPKECVLDESRLDFVKDQSLTLNALMLGNLKGHNRFRRLLLGSKAVGKTTSLLDSLLKAAEATFGSNLLTFKVSYCETSERLALLVCHYLSTVGITFDLESFIQEAQIVSKTALNVIRSKELTVLDLMLSTV